jgi:hypothetical protein
MWAVFIGWTVHNGLLIKVGKASFTFKEKGSIVLNCTSFVPEQNNYFLSESKLDIMVMIVSNTKRVSGIIKRTLKV